MKITTKIRSVGAVLSLFLLFLIAVTIYLIETEKRNEDIINMAGRERMLTQIISKEVFYALMQQQWHNGAYLKARDEMLKNFEILDQGDTSLGINVPPTKNIANQLDHVGILMERFVHSTDSFNEKYSVSSQLYQALQQQSKTLAELSEKVVVEAVKRNAGEACIDRAGKQRMMIQKMAHLTTQFFSMPSETIITELNNNMNSYTLTLDALSKNSVLSNDEITAQLYRENIEKFDIYKRDLMTFVTAHAQVHKEVSFIYEYNTILLDAVNSVVLSYTQYSNEEKHFFETVQLIAGAIALILVLISFFIIRTIMQQFEQFSQKTQSLTIDEEEQVCSRSNELEQASSGLDSFVKRVDQAIIHAQMAIAESQTAAQQIGTLTDDIESALEEECKNPVMKESVSKYIDRSEDLAIESIEELRSTSLLLEKLHQSLHAILQENAEISKKE